MFTDQRKDKKAVLYLKRKLAVLEWIKDYFTVRNEFIERGCTDLIQLIEDGVVLCRLLNLFFPNCIDKIIYTNSMVSTKYFLRIENINAFIAQCQRLHVPVIFQTLDLFEGKNPVRVVNCIHSLIESLDPYNNLKDRVINKKNKFSIEEISRAALELQIEKEASGKSMSNLLYDTINPSLDHDESNSNSTLLDNNENNTTTTIFNNSIAQQSQPQSLTSTVNQTPIQTPLLSTIKKLQSSIINRTPTTSSGAGGRDTFGTVQYQMTNSNTYESNELSVLNTSHLRTTIIKTPLSRINNSVYNSNESNTSFNYQNTPQIHNTPGYPLSMYQHDQQLATSSMMKTASISAIPVKTSPSPISDYKFITNSTYSNRYNSINNNNNNSNNSSTIRNVNNNNNNNNNNFTPYRPLPLISHISNIKGNHDLRISDLNSLTSTINTNASKQQQHQSPQQSEEYKKRQQLQHQQHIQQQQKQQQLELEKQKERELYNLSQQQYQSQQHQSNQQQHQQAEEILRQQQIIQQQSEQILQQSQVISDSNRPTTWCKDILITLILIVSIFVWFFLYISNDTKLNDLLNGITSNVNSSTKTM